MGMAAGQARLLTITARLNNNELRSMHLTNAKIRLADTTEKVGEDYINALNDSQLLYSTYDTNGNISYEKLTGNSLSYYGPLKNQYGLVNSAGQIMVSELDGKNFKESKNLGEFLEKYGVATQEINTYDNPEYVKAGSDLYGDDWKNWAENGTGTPGGNYKIWTDELGKLQQNEPKQEDYQQWVEDKTIIIHNRPKPSENDFLIDDPNWVPPVVDPDDTENTWSLYDAFMNGTAGGCFSCSSNPNSSQYNIVRHFNHTLAHMLVDNSGIWEGNHWWNKPDGGVDGTSGDAKIMAQIAKALEGKTCCGETSCNESHNHNFYGTNVHFDCGNEVCDGNQLISDKIFKLMEDIAAYAGKDYGKKGDDNDPVWIGIKQRYYHLIEHDLQGVLENVVIPKDPPEAPKIVDRDAYEKAMDAYEKDISYGGSWVDDVPAWQEAHDGWAKEYEAIEEEIRKAVENFNGIVPTLSEQIIKISDQDASQWYVNLWHRMNGESDFKSGTGAEQGFAGWISDSKTNENYTVLEDGLMNSPEWLKFALEHGAITLEKVQFSDPSIAGDGLKNVQWVSTIYSSVTDIVEQKNEKAATLAEVRYNQAMREIESKDKEYDNQIKLLDTEHNALQTEYDSVKGTIEKNVERTFKAFS